jgi:hypothetical protein
MSPVWSPRLCHQYALPLPASKHLFVLLVAGWLRICWNSSIHGWDRGSLRTSSSIYSYSAHVAIFSRREHAGSTPAWRRLLTWLGMMLPVMRTSRKVLFLLHIVYTSIFIQSIPLHDIELHEDSDAASKWTRWSKSFARFSALPRDWVESSDVVNCSSRRHTSRFNCQLGVELVRLQCPSLTYKLRPVIPAPPRFPDLNFPQLVENLNLLKSMWPTAGRARVAPHVCKILSTKQVANPLWEQVIRKTRK